MGKLTVQARVGVDGQALIEEVFLDGVRCADAMRREVKTLSEATVELARDESDIPCPFFCAGGDGSCRRADPLQILELIGMLLSEIGRLYRDDSDRAHSAKHQICRPGCPCPNHRPRARRARQRAEAAAAEVQQNFQEVFDPRNAS